jgi:pyruvate, water dikinase
LNYDKKQIDKVLEDLNERAKELKCLYTIEELLNRSDYDLESIYDAIILAIPPGWQYSEICQARIIIDDKAYCSPNFRESEWVLSAEIKIQVKVIGSISVYYTKKMPTADQGPFLKDEARLIGIIAERLGHSIMYHRMKHVSAEWDIAKENITEHKRVEWRIVLKLLKQTDKNLYFNIAHKMLNFLCWSGIPEAENLRHVTGIDRSLDNAEMDRDQNRPHQKKLSTISMELIDKVFNIAANHLNNQEILSQVHKWIQEDKLSFLVQVVNRNLSLSEVADAIRRYHHIESEGAELHSPAKRGVAVSLIRRFLSDQLPFINIAKNFINIDDFYDLLKRVMFSAESHGKLGGKSAGLYLASQILRKTTEDSKEIGKIKIPKTWHITSDLLLHFMHFNNFDEVVEQKYKGINQIRFEYPHIVQTFKNSIFPPEMIKGLSVALDDLADQPLVVRSSSLLEDRTGSTFSGKYKSLFLANQGSKRDRLEALLDAIAEIYASTFSPDPIEYRAERGLIDFGEEMGIMIQEVVGTKIGHYFLPAFAGVAFSRNEFRWSPRIKREDGLLRLVPGLGTRAVDRLSDDYPVLVAPGQPNLRVNPTAEEVVKYSPKMVDVINLDTNSFETIEIEGLLKDYGTEYPGLNRVASKYEDDTFCKLMPFNTDFDNDDLIITFDGLVNNTSFIKKIQAILKLLENKIEQPVDIEFASDGKDFYLLQCRAQSYSPESAPAPIPKEVAEDRILFSSNRYISNGTITDITHIVYVNPDQYYKLSDRTEMLRVGRAVGKLNKLLPKRQFILMGPGRWGSRGDIRLGVSITYSDINNCAVLLEIARKKGNYTPDLSFGTHFFQDLVEANIRYIPLYPDDEGIIFNEQFLKKAENILPDVLPGFAHLQDTIHLIDIPRSTDGRVLNIFLNADLDEGLAIFAQPSEENSVLETTAAPEVNQRTDFWHWRMHMAEYVASKLNPERFGVKAFYVFGSTKNATAGPGSDIDLLVHFIGTQEQRNLLAIWMEGWNDALTEINYQRTGYRIDDILDIHYVTDEDIANRTSYAVKIGAVTDAARSLKLMNSNSSSK